MRQDSFEDYVRASGPRLKRLAFLLTGDLNEAEDLLQSAYAKAMPHWTKISGYDVPDAYMRRVVVLRYWCDLSEAEAALTMGCSIGTVKSTTSKGLARLRAGLAVNVPLEGEAS